MRNVLVAVSVLCALPAIAQTSAKPAPAPLGATKVTGARVGSVQVTNEECRKLFVAMGKAEGKQESPKGYDAATLLECTFRTVNNDSKAEADVIGVSSTANDGVTTITVVDIARDAAKQAGDVKKACEVVAGGVATTAAISGNSAAAVYSGTFGTMQCDQLAKEVKKKNPMLILLPPAYVGPYLIAKSDWKKVESAGKDAIEHVLPESNEDTLLMLNPTTRIFVIGKKAEETVRKALPKVRVKLGG